MRPLLLCEPKTLPSRNALRPRVAPVPPVTPMHGFLGRRGVSVSGAAGELSRRFRPVGVRLVKETSDAPLSAVSEAVEG